MGEPVDPEPARPPERRPLEGRFVRVRPLAPDADAEPLWDGSHDGSAEAERLWMYMYEPFADRAAMRDWLDGCAASTDPLFMTIESRDGSSTTTESCTAVGVSGPWRVGR